jgi:hypothetical protein
MHTAETQRSHILAISVMLDGALKLADQVGDDVLAAHIEHARACAAERLESLK